MNLASGPSMFQPFIFYKVFSLCFHFSDFFSKNEEIEEILSLQNLVF